MLRVALLRHIQPQLCNSELYQHPYEMIRLLAHERELDCRARKHVVRTARSSRFLPDAPALLSELELLQSEPYLVLVSSRHVVTGTQVVGNECTGPAAPCRDVDPQQLGGAQLTVALGSWVRAPHAALSILYLLLARMVRRRQENATTAIRLRLFMIMVHA